MAQYKLQLRWRLGKLLQGRALSELRGASIGNRSESILPVARHETRIGELTTNAMGEVPRAGGSRQENVPVGRDTDVASRNRG